MKQIIIFLSLILILLVNYKVYALHEIDIDRDHFLIEEIDEFENNRIVKDIEPLPLYYVDIGLVTEADCDDIKWTVEGQTHQGVLNCDNMLIFTGAWAGDTYSCVVEGCDGGRFEGYLQVGYDDTLFVICPNQLQTTHCCPEGKMSDGSYFCDECPETVSTTTTMQATTTTIQPTTTTIQPTTTSTSSTTTSVLPAFSISGNVTGDITSNVSIILSGTASKTHNTDINGYYEFSDLYSGYYTITPNKEGYSFEPPNYMIQNLTSDLYDMNFISTEITPPPPCSAEAIYGEDSEETELLRYFRDNILIKTPEGQEIIKLYYQWSPAIVKVMKEDEKFKEEVKEIIDGILQSIREEIE